MTDSDTPLSCPVHPDGAPEDGCQACDDILDALEAGNDAAGRRCDVESLARSP